MKEYQFIEGIFSNKVIVDFGPPLKSGEIIKINSPEPAVKMRDSELLFSPFEMTGKGITPVVAAINNLNKNKLYNKALNWTDSFCQIQNQASITSVADEKISINCPEKNVHYGTELGMDVFADLPYLFVVDFADREIRMTFTFGDKNGDITDENGEVMAGTSPSHMFMQVLK